VPQQETRLLGPRGQAYRAAGLAGPAAGVDHAAD